MYIQSRFNVIYQLDKKGEYFVVNPLYGTSVKVVTGSNGWINKKEYQVNQINDPVVCQLLKYNFLVPKNLDELRLNRYLRTRKLYEGKSRVQVVLGNRCNLRCTYCWQDHTDQKDLTIEDSRQLMDFLTIEMRKKGSLSVDWIGGEPLLYLNFVHSVSSQIIKRIKKRNVIYSAGIVTNGILLEPDLFLELVKKDSIYTFMITVDGTKELHNQLRPLKNQDSFQIIRDNLEHIFRVKPSYVTVLLRINVSPEMIGKEKEIADSFTGFGQSNKLEILAVPTVNHISDTAKIDVGTYLNFCIALKSYGLNLKPVYNLKFMSGVCSSVYDGSYIFLNKGKFKKCALEAFEPSLSDLYQNIETINYFAQWQEQDLQMPCEECRFLPACQGLVCPHHKGRCLMEMVFHPRYGQALYEETVPVIKIP